MSKEFALYFIGITSQIFIIGIGLWILKSLLDKKKNSSLNQDCFDKLDSLTKYFETKFEFVFKAIDEIKIELKDIKRMLK